jgi:hypothetical protein
MTIGDITAWAGQKKFALQRRGIPVSYSLIHRVKMEIFIRDDQVDQVIKAIIDTRTWKQGDGMITVLFMVYCHDFGSNNNNNRHSNRLLSDILEPSPYLIETAFTLVDHVATDCHNYNS